MISIGHQLIYLSSNQLSLNYRYRVIILDHHWRSHLMKERRTYVIKSGLPQCSLPVSSGNLLGETIRQNRFTKSLADIPHFSFPSILHFILRIHTTSRHILIPIMPSSSSWIKHMKKKGIILYPFAKKPNEIIRINSTGGRKRGKCLSHSNSFHRENNERKSVTFFFVGIHKTKWKERILHCCNKKIYFYMCAFIVTATKIYI